MVTAGLACPRNLATSTQSVPDKIRADAQVCRSEFSYEPKTTAGKRTIDLAPELVSALKPWKLACPTGAL